MSDPLYDEFGNYIGPELEDDNEADDDQNELITTEADDLIDEDDEEMQQEQLNDAVLHEARYSDNNEQSSNGTALTPSTGNQQITLHEDQQLYPEANELYGDDVEIAVGDIDTQPLSQPIIKPLTSTKFSIYESTPPAQLRYDQQYMLQLLRNSPTLTRNVTVAGNLHSGKTSLMDLLIEHTHPSYAEKFNSAKHDAPPFRYTDTHYDEQARGLSLKCTPMTLLLPNLQDKSYVTTFIDTPGHIQFSDEVSASVRLTDGMLVVIDVVEGIRPHTQSIIQHAIREYQQIVLVLNKIDRLIIDLKLPPTDSYYKLQYILEEANSIVREVNYQMRDRDENLKTKDGVYHHPLFSPTSGNVIFSSAIHGWSFTLPSFAQLYCEQHLLKLDPAKLAHRLWGDWTYNTDKHKFHPRSNIDEPHTFVTFVLEPLYKLYSHSLGMENKELQQWLSKELQINITSKQLQLDARPLLKLICQQFFVNPVHAMQNAIVKHVASPLEAANRKVRHTYGGSLETTMAQHMLSSEPDAPLVIHVTKQMPSPDAEQMYALGRIISGSVKTNDTVRVLGSTYTLDDQEDSSVQTVTSIQLMQSRYNIDLPSAGAGSIVLLGGLSEAFTKTATVIDMSPQAAQQVEVFKPLTYMTQSCIKVALEPFIPSDLPKMIAALRAIDRTYPLAQTKVEESGEHVLIGSGELSIDCMLHDLRRIYSRGGTEVEIKVSDPSTIFVETLAEQARSTVPAVAQTPNKKNTVTFIAEALDNDLVRDLEHVLITADNRELLRTKYHWDALAVENLWALGPTTYLGTNILINETTHSVDAEDDEHAQLQMELLASVRDSIVNGFQWAMREGPLADEPVRGVCIKLIDSNFSSNLIERARGQLIPTARRAIYSAMLLASPRLAEPIFAVHLTGQPTALPLVTKLISRRRGHVQQSAPIPGTPLISISGHVPVIDSFGLEVDIRSATHGAVNVAMPFSHWHRVPGDPQDASITLRPLEPAPTPALAREFMLKTRRRKGLPESVSLTRYVDEKMIEMLAQSDPELAALVEANR